MTKELLKFEITEALVKVQVESALALSFSNRGETEALAAQARRAKKASIISSSSFENIIERSRMKTPKRNKGNSYGAAYCPYEGPTQAAFEHARWKRKNRIKQMKRTIERLRWENFHMKIDLHIPINISYDEYHSRRVDFTEKKPEPYFD